MTVKVTAKTDFTPFQRIDTTVRASPKLMQTALKRNISRFESRFAQQQQEREPPPPARPIRWSSAKQRRAYFATNGFGAGIPYPRSHQLSKNYHVKVVTDGDYGGTVTVSNDTPGAEFVIGARQQPFLIQWENIIDTADRASEDVGVVTGETWLTVSDPFAGVKA